MRDNERQKTYDAEQIVRRISERGGEIEMFGSRIVWPVERRFGHLEHVEAYIEQVMKLGWFQMRYPRAAATSVKVRQRRGAKFAHYERFPAPTVAINDPTYGKPGWAMRELVSLHELAHHVIAFEKPGVEPHGVEFRSVFVDLVSVVIGPEAGWVLQMTFLDSGLAVVAGGSLV